MTAVPSSARTLLRPSRLAIWLTGSLLSSSFSPFFPGFPLMQLLLLSLWLPNRLATLLLSPSSFSFLTAISWLTIRLMTLLLSTSFLSPLTAWAWLVLWLAASLSFFSLFFSSTASTWLVLRLAALFFPFLTALSLLAIRLTTL
jgi:hypothetical protein